jgi:outer membrane protein OmpA-like peptidoglycan-associated protein
MSAAGLFRVPAYLLLGLQCVSPAAAGVRQAPVLPGRLHADIRSAERRGDSLYVDMDLVLRDMAVRSGQSLLLEPALVSPDGLGRATLPAVELKGGRRLKIDRRDSLLAARKGVAVRPADMARPRLVGPVSATGVYRVPGGAVLAWEPWMEHARIEYAYTLEDCCRASASGTGLATDSLPGLRAALSVVEPPEEAGASVWHPDASVYGILPVLEPARAESIKKRSRSVFVELTYRQGKYDVDASWGDNRSELSKMDSLIMDVIGNPLLKIDQVIITGYASIEGTAPANQKLSYARAAGLATYIRRLLGNRLQADRYVLRGSGENWAELARLVPDAVTDIALRDSVLSIISGSRVYDYRERLLMQLDNGSVYRGLMEFVFPRLRHTNLEIACEVSALSGDEAAQLVDSQPGLLSLAEIYGAAGGLVEGAPRLMDLCRIAVDTYPDDPVANNNMAAMLLRRGLAEEAAPYLEKAGDGAYALVNRAAGAYIRKDPGQAKTYLEEAYAKEPANPAVSRAAELLGIVLEEN